MSLERHPDGCTQVWLDQIAQYQRTVPVDEDAPLEEEPTIEDHAREIGELREAVIERNKALVSAIRTRQGNIDLMSIALGARIETLVDMVCPVGTLEREQYTLGVEIRLGAVFAAILEQLSKQSLLVPPGAGA